VTALAGERPHDGATAVLFPSGHHRPLALCSHAIVEEMRSELGLAVRPALEFCSTEMCGPLSILI
jgi:hypothetical protein